MTNENKDISVSDFFDLDIKDVEMLAPLTLAYIGDGVYDLYIRTRLLKERVTPVHMLHKRTIVYVKAKAQAIVAHKIFERLTEKEQSVLKRGRNAKSATVPKNAELNDYKHATGFEALLGYLYLKKDFYRLKEILIMASEIIENNRIESK